MSNWIIEKLAGYCGARLHGVSLEKATLSALVQMREALFEYGVIVMPNQHLSPEGHIAIAEFFGKIDVNRFFTPVTNYPNIAEVQTVPGQKEVIGGTWHTDHSYDKSPAMCSILNAKRYCQTNLTSHWLSP